MKIIFFITLLEFAILGQQAIKNTMKYEGSSSIPYIVADFGDIPWGRKLSGQLALASPLDACQPIEDFNKNFVLIQRGGCPFTTKVRNAQVAGYSLAIIYDNQPESKQQISLADDGTGFSIKIPSIFIDQKNGEKLKNGLQANQYNLTNPQDIVIDLKFEDKNQTVLVLGIDLMNNKTFQFLSDFEMYQQQFEELKIKLEVQYWIFSIPSYVNESFVSENCLSEGKYCANQSNLTNKGTGKEVASEILRELCVFNVAQKSQWFQYMKYFNQICSEAQSFEQCSKNIRKLIEIDDEQFDDCILSSFYDPNTYKTVVFPSQDLTQLPNRLIDHQLDLASKTSIRNYPSISINGQIYRGRLYAQNILNEICNGLTETPLVCIQNQEDSKQNNLLISSQSTSQIKIVTIIAVLIALVISGVLLSKKLMKKQNNNNAANQELQEVM